MKKSSLMSALCFFLLSTFMLTPSFATEIEPVRQAAEGLTYPSETDAPFETVLWPEITIKELLPERLLALLKLPENTPVETVSVEEFFARSTQAEEWHNEEEAAEVERFKALEKCIKETLADAKVFRVGETKIDCYIVGNIESGGCGGLKTHVVET